jgi:hypothetical protein
MVAIKPKSAAEAKSVIVGVSGGQAAVRVNGDKKGADSGCLEWKRS